MFRHIRIWNEWRKYSLNSWWHKMLVLFKLRRSPTLEMYFYDTDVLTRIRSHADEYLKERRNELPEM